MDYKDALEIAGATVHCYGQFGSYQGDWVAKVTWNGKTGWIKDYYGSCSGCDALVNDFGFSNHECGDDDYYDPFLSGFKDDCEECQAEKKRFAEFGKKYLSEMITQEQIEKKISEDIDWDLDAQELLNFVKENKII